MEAAVSTRDGGDQGAAGCREDATSMDAYLRKPGLYGKMVSKDGSCLFLAVAEQVLHSQSRHVNVRMTCIHYLQENREKFEESPAEILNRLVPQSGSPGSRPSADRCPVEFLLCQVALLARSLLSSQHSAVTASCCCMIPGPIHVLSRKTF
nr:OTU domain-containing protein 4-like [Manis javanica]